MTAAPKPWQVIWLTGLPCSGKTTLARALQAAWPHRVTVLDGDELRAGPCADLGYTREDRIEQARRAATLALHHRRADGVTVVATISPYHACRELAGAILGPSFLEVHVDASIETCCARDVKGHWAAAMRGELQNFSGVGDVYEQPRAPHLRLRTDVESIDQSTARIMRWLSASTPPGGRSPGRSRR